MIHKLKIKEKYADAICGNAKLFEIRKDDRNYSAGDIVVFEVIDIEKYYSHGINGRAYFIPYVLRHDDFPDGIKEGYCAFSIVQLSDDLGYYYTHNLEVV